LKLHSCLADLQKNGKNLKKTKKIVLTKAIEYGIINKLVYSGNTNILLGGIETMRVQVILECTETKLRHYVTTKNKKTHPERLEMRKYNPVLKRHSLYREVK
jgi:ribosomal protein L33